MRSRMRLTSLLGGLVIVIALAAGGYFWWTESPHTKFSGPVEKITIGAENSLLQAAVWVAENNGYFEEEGLDINIKVFTSGRENLIAMLNGEGIDVGAAAPTPIMFNSFLRKDFYIFGTFSYSYNDVIVIANKNSGINSVNDIKGKKIGTLMGSSGQFFTEAFLVYNSISPSDVEMVDISPSELPKALKNGQIDVQIIWEPHGTAAKDLLGDKAIKLPSADVYKATFNFLTMKNFATEHPEVLEKFLRAINKATDFVNSNTEKSQEIMAKRLNFKKEEVALHWVDFTFELSLGQSLLINIEDEARWAIRNNLTDAKEIPNYLDYIYMDALESVKPEAVTIIR